MKSLLGLFLLLWLSPLAKAFDANSVVLCKDTGSDGQSRTFLIDLGLSDLKKAGLLGDAVYYNSNNVGWKPFTGSTSLFLDKTSSALHFAFKYTNLENGYNTTLGSGSLDIQFSNDLNSVHEQDASCSIAAKKPDHKYSSIALACAETKTQADWFIVTGTLATDLIRSSTRPLPASEQVLLGSETTRQAPLMYVGGGGISGSYTYMKPGAGNIYDMIEKHYVPVTVKVGAKTAVLTSRKYPPEPKDIESRIPCVRKF